MHGGILEGIHSLIVYFMVLHCDCSVDSTPLHYILPYMLLLTLPAAD